MTPPLDPKPVSPALDAHLREALSHIPTGKRGQLSAAVTTLGVEAAVGAKVHSHVTVSGWAGKAWGAPGWSGGARAQVIW